MIHDSITLKTFSRTRHFGDLSREQSLENAGFIQDQLGYYLANTFAKNSACQVSGGDRNTTDRAYTIRKGSAVLTVETSFGINTTYDTVPPRKFYSLTTSVSHHNETLDNTDKVNDAIEWTFRIVGALVIGGICAIAISLVLGVISGHLLVAAFSVGAGLGGMIGQCVGRLIQHRVEQRLESRGEITDMDREWSMLTDTVDMIFAEELAPPVADAVQ